MKTETKNLETYNIYKMRDFKNENFNVGQIW